jgi:hypothetical protein
VLKEGWDVRNVTTIVGLRAYVKAYRAEPLPDTGFFHGKNSGRLVVVGPINLQVGRLFVEEVITECRKRGARGRAGVRV